MLPTSAGPPKACWIRQTMKLSRHGQENFATDPHGSSRIQLQRSRKDKASLQDVVQDESPELSSGSKVQEKANLHINGSQVVQQLGLVERLDLTASLHFYNDKSIDEEIGSETTYNLSSEYNYQRHLSPN